MKNKIGMMICDLGIWILSLGPKDARDREMEREFISRWRAFRGFL
jgi:hypothetical protein